MTTSDWIALSVGGYAAIVATAVLVWNIIKARGGLTIKIELWGVGGDEIVSIEIIITNKTLRPIDIESIGFTKTNGGTYEASPRILNCPRTIPPASNRHCMINYTEILERLDGNQPKNIFIKDTTGRKYKRRIPKNVFRE